MCFLNATIVLNYGIHNWNNLSMYCISGLVVKFHIAIYPEVMPKCIIKGEPKCHLKRYHPSSFVIYSLRDLCLAK